MYSIQPKRALLSGGAAGFARQLDLQLHAFAAFEIEGTPAFSMDAICCKGHLCFRHSHATGGLSNLSGKIVSN
jgi:hypothetical protein